MTDTIANRLFESSRIRGHAEGDLSDALEAAGIPFDDYGWDSYDGSLELKGVPDDFRLSSEQQTAIYKMGFAKVYVNHINKWETHYPGAWRVSYPHRRGDDGKIWVEKRVAGWPADWFETGYVEIRPPADCT